ncbi:Qat anti-phage system associated protein QatB [Flavobacterium subsaxonicum]|uniref:Uncharacterized protein n=1 Tax=Flavobacterium subsaxonicum WB 4.1-42 = DSM 21790 TaxID=1121898 RepID=A0A0A2MRX9_9FLAO|nr:Qat anti-phage system associated protein QatB [Flavobacterium subsaxonicum]KGO91015.1 hypothetical protein Q766_20205 [Flavobacterium subsaxonicum WB 4.1-42 = DSM 21790]
MGTSASNGGPRGSSPLLPDWFSSTAPAGDNNPPAENPMPSNNPVQDTANSPIVLPDKSSNWGQAKGALTRLTNGTGGSSRQKASRNYVKSLGGARGATKASAQGVRTGVLYSGFLGSLASSGATNTFSSYGLQNLIGKSAEEVCAGIVNAIAPNGSTNDEAIAREALIETLDSLYTKLLENGDVNNTLDNLTSELIKETLIEYVGNFIFTKWMYELGSAIEKGNISEREAIKLEKEVREFIINETVEKYKDVSITESVDNQSTETIIEEIFQTAYSILEL